jgi:plastocyanin
MQIPRRAVRDAHRRSLKPGTYEWYCPVGRHREFGMEGEITVSG